MPNYATVPRFRVKNEYEEDRPLYSSISVIEQDDSPVPTGIYDTHGVQLYRVSDRVPCGFTASAFVKKGE